MTKNALSLIFSKGSGRRNACSGLRMILQECAKKIEAFRLECLKEEGWPDPFFQDQSPVL